MSVRAAIATPMCVGCRLRIGKFSQHHVDGMDMKKTPLEIFQSMSTGVGGTQEDQAIRPRPGERETSLLSFRDSKLALARHVGMS